MNRQRLMTMLAVLLGLIVGVSVVVAATWAEGTVDWLLPEQDSTKSGNVFVGHQISSWVPSNSPTGCWFSYDIHSVWTNPEPDVWDVGWPGLWYLNPGQSRTVAGGQEYNSRGRNGTHYVVDTLWGRDSLQQQWTLLDYEYHDYTVSN